MGFTKSETNANLDPFRPKNCNLPEGKESSLG